MNCHNIHCISEKHKDFEETFFKDNLTEKLTNCSNPISSRGVNLFGNRKYFLAYSIENDLSPFILLVSILSPLKRKGSAPVISINV